jgi:hypothetical protein
MRGILLLGTLTLVLNFVFAANITASPSQCFNLTANSTVTIYINNTALEIGNSSPYSICMKDVPIIFFNKIISHGDTYFNQSEYCSVNISTPNQQICSRSATINPGSTYTYADSSCNINVGCNSYNITQNNTCSQQQMNFSWMEYITADGSRISITADNQSSPITYPYNVRVNGTDVINTFSITIPRTFTCPAVAPASTPIITDTSYAGCYRYFSSLNSSDVNAFAFTRWVDCEESKEEKISQLLSLQSEKTNYETLYGEANQQYDACATNISFYSGQYDVTEVKYMNLLDEYKNQERTYATQRDIANYNLIACNILWLSFAGVYFLIKKLIDKKIGFGGM